MNKFTLFVTLISVLLVTIFYNVEGQQTYRLTTIIDEPYLMLKEESGKLVGNDKYEGFAKDLADALSKRCNFSYILNLVNDNRYGHKDKSGKWNGMVGELTRNVSDLAIASLTITKERSEVVDFSSSFLEFQWGILLKKPSSNQNSQENELANKGSGDKSDGEMSEVDKKDKKEEEEMAGESESDEKDEDDDRDDDGGPYKFICPLSGLLWLFFILSLIILPILLYGIEIMIARKIESQRLVGTLVLVPPPSFFANGLLGSPRTISGRLIQVIYWVFVVIFVAAYISSFTADRIVDRLGTEDEDGSLAIKNIKDLVDDQNDILYGVIRGGSTYDFFIRSTDPLYKKMFTKMNKGKTLVRTIEEGVNRVRTGNGTSPYAFIMESPMATYYTSRKPCNLMMAPSLFGPKKGFGVATRPNHPLKSVINLAILEMKENGELTNLETKWFKDRGECEVDDDSTQNALRGESDPLTLSDMAGLFYLLLTAVFIALLIGAAEFAISKNKQTTTNGSKDRSAEVPLRSASNRV